MIEVYRFWDALSHVVVLLLWERHNPHASLAVQTNLERGNYEIWEYVWEKLP